MAASRIVIDDRRTPGVQLYSGPDSVRAAKELRDAIQNRRDAWPYPHIYPPEQSSDVLQINSVSVGAPGATVEVLKYQVQSGKRFFLRAVVFQIDITFAVGAGLWTLDRNAAVGATANTQYDPEHGLINVPVLLGSNVFTPWWLARARVFEPLDVLRIKCKNVSLGGANLIGIIMGYEVPVTTVKGRK